MAFLNKELSKKEIALYQAVAELIEEGADITTMKVSDITAKAGIGKGTAYEYFKSKEELLAKAFIYNMNKGIAGIEKRIREKRAFKEMFFTLLDEVDRGLSCNNSYTMLYYVLNGFQFLSTKLEDELEKNRPLARGYRDVSRTLIDTAESEDLMERKQEEFFYDTAILGQVISYIHYLREKEYLKNITEADVKEFLYSNLVSVWSRMRSAGTV